MRNMAIATAFLIAIVISNAGAVIAQSGPPTPNQVFVDKKTGTGHDFSENYWDIMVHNNSKWEVNDPTKHIDNMTTWLNNTWRIIYVNEGNFQMGFLAFMNKSGKENDGKDYRYYTPAQFWFMHYYIDGHEMIIGNMLAAWFGFSDTNHDGNYTTGEDLNPFFYMTQENSNGTMKEFPSVTLNTNVKVSPLQRTTSLTQINYTWALNYSNIVFYLPRTYHNNSTFAWGFDYSNPSTYQKGSFAFGVQDYIYYKYTLVLDGAAKLATLYSDYKSGDISKLYLRDDDTNKSSPFHQVPNTNIPRSWVFCTGNWAMILAGVDKKVALNETVGGDSITANTTMNGLTTVKATVEGTNVFNYEFKKKPNYTQYEENNAANHTTKPVLYACLDINHNPEFLNLVAGMTQLIGSFSHLMISYVINQTNHFTGGITFEKAWQIFDPKATAAFFITGYSGFGWYNGGVIDHDPVFSAFFTPGSDWGQQHPDLLIILLVSLGGGIVAFTVIEYAYKKKKRSKALTSS